MATFFLLLIASLTSYVLGACDNIEVRREWRNFTTSEKTEWIDAVKCMSHLPHNDSLYSSVGTFAATFANITTNSSYYDDWAYVHCDLNTRIHFTGLFFPFHRFYIWAYNQALKSHCGYTGVSPYWDWSKDSADVLASGIWNDDTSSGLGQANGVATKDMALSSGGFSENFTLAYPASHDLRRNFTLRPYAEDTGVLFPDPSMDANASFTPEMLQQAIQNNTGNYKGFQKFMEGYEGPHGSVHLMTGGDLGGHCPENGNAYCKANQASPTYSANDPLFWLHHGMVDKLWWEWQNYSPDNANAFYGGSVQNITTTAEYLEFPNGAPPLLGMSTVLPSNGILPEGYTLGDVWSTEDDLCYTYE